MPKLREYESMRKNRMLAANIRKYLTLANMTVEKLAVPMHMAKSTLYNRINHPETFTLFELRKLFETLPFTPEEREALF